MFKPNFLNPVFILIYMKHLHVILLFFLFSIYTNAQSISNQVIASGGTFYQTNTGSIAYTIAEPVSTTLTSGGKTLTQGFHQVYRNPLQIKLFLEGPYIGNAMTTHLQNGTSVMPLHQPYNTAPWNYQGAEKITSIPANVTDWILVEVRNGINNPEIVEQAAAFLMSDGTVQDIDGNPGIKFDNLKAGTPYHFVIRHRNHLAILSDEYITFPYNGLYDFSISSYQAYGPNQLKHLNDEVFVLFAGDFNADGAITVGDYNFYAAEVSAINQYTDADANLDKQVTVADFNLYQPNASKIGVPQVRY